MPTLSPRWLALGIAVAATSANALAADTTVRNAGRTPCHRRVR